MPAEGVEVAGLLAQATELGPNTYFSLIKIGAFAGLFVLWCLMCQWVDRDADFVKTKREQWNLIVVSGGIAGLLMWLVVPLALGSGIGSYLLGLAFWLLLAGGSAMSYVFHRNGRVVQSRRVMTMSHFKRVLGGGGDKKKRVDKGSRVRLADHEGKAVEPPEDAEEYEQYSATQDFLYDVIWRRATDVDMIVGKEEPQVVYRIDGVASKQEETLSQEDAERVVAYLKQLAGLNPEERRRPQTARMQAALLSDPSLKPVEVHASGSTSGERMRLRLISQESEKRLSDLNLRDAQKAVFDEVIKEPSGLVIFSGPKQSGVTTTQYAVIRDHDAFMQNLNTLERNPLFELDNITQNKAKGDASGVTYARQLQSLLRREPDVVLIGETQDRETAQMAVRAGAGARKIYLALEAKDAYDALHKVRESADDNAALAEGLLLVVNQRLVRVLCENCREAFKPDPKLLKKLNLPVDKIEHFYRPPTEPITDKKGRPVHCPSCQGSGYRGRKAVFELLRIDETASALIAEGAPVQRLKDHYRRLRTPDLWRAGLQEVYDGNTSLDEILRALKSNTK